MPAASLINRVRVHCADELRLKYLHDASLGLLYIHEQHQAMHLDIKASAAV